MLANDAVRDALVNTLPTASPVDLERSFRLLDHQLVSIEPADCGPLLALLSALINKAQRVATTLLQNAKPFLFKLEGLQRICRSTLLTGARDGER